MTLKTALVLLAYLLVLLFFSLNPWLHPDSGPAFGDVTWDKIDHALAYSLLSCLLLFANRQDQRHAITSLVVLLSCSSLGILVEYCQLWFTETRQFSYQDALANSIGSAVGVVVFWCVWLLASRGRKRVINAA